MTGRIEQLKQALAAADSYAEWETIGLELDQLTGLEQWKLNNESPYYDYGLIADRMVDLRRLRLGGQWHELMRALREGLHHDLGNMGHPLLYGHSYVGTKYLIENYIEEACLCLKVLSEQATPEISPHEKRQFFEHTLQSYGQPALMFSGGATLGLFHTGVYKALYEQSLLPRVFSGSSAGSLMAGMVGTHTDAEMLEMAEGEGFYNHAFRFRSWREMLQGGGLADVLVLKNFLRQNLGDFTFEEAFQRSGRHINMVVAPYDSHQKPRVMNELTSPYLLLWSASLASCAVPVLFPPVRLTAKDEQGNLRPYLSDTRWVDGSLRSDFPKSRISRLYNINYTIAVQVNPHIVPFMSNDQDRYRSNLLSWPARAVRKQGQLLGMGMMEFARDRVERFPDMHRTFDHGVGIMGQRYYGNINIVADYDLRHFTYTLRNPTPALLRQLCREGERATWPRISQIRTHAQIGKTLEACLKHLCSLETKPSVTDHDQHEVVPQIHTVLDSNLSVP